MRKKLMFHGWCFLIGVGIGKLISHINNVKAEANAYTNGVRDYLCEKIADLETRMEYLEQDHK
jgi:hypothetical protein